jgi:ClpP class serine protease
MWLLEASVRKQIERAQAAGITPTAEQQIGFSAQASSRILVTAGEVAEITVKGVLTKEPSFLAMLFGGGNTTFPEIISALAEAQANPAIKKAILVVDSPGGTVAGLFEAIAAIEVFSKPIESRVSGMAASAAFALVAATDKIIATSRAASFGSIGIVAGFRVDDGIIEITSTDAPKKRPDVTTEEGVAMVREELDALHEIFVESIASGRDKTTEEVNAKFGQGATLLAGQALKRGMIDAIAEPKLSVVASADPKLTARNGGNNSEKGPMDLQELKAQHPAVYAAAVQEGVTLGTTDERDRVGAHLTMGEASGDMKTAIAAVKDGTGMTVSLQATYMAAGMNRADVDTRQGDNAAADTGDADQSIGDDIATREAKVGANILGAAAASCGVEMGAL